MPQLYRINPRSRVCDIQNCNWLKELHRPRRRPRVTFRRPGCLWPALERVRRNGRWRLFARCPQRAIDHHPKLVLWQPANDTLAIDEQRGRRIDSQLVALLHGGANLRLILLLHAGVELSRVQLDQGAFLARDPVQRCVALGQVAILARHLVPVRMQVIDVGPVGIAALCRQAIGIH